MAGFTTVRNLGDSFNETVALRNAINRGVAVGPRIFTTAKSIATTGGHEQQCVPTAHEGVNHLGLGRSEGFVAKGVL